jgi:hypothetical protein
MTRTGRRRGLGAGCGHIMAATFTKSPWRRLRKSLGDRMSNEIQLEVDNHVAILTLAAPDRRNAFVPAMVHELLEACDEIDRNQDVGAVVVRALGASFCSGAHRDLLAGVVADPARPDNYEAVMLTYRAFARVGDLLPPSIAAVRGHAVGAGVNLMMAADLRVVAETAKIISGFARIGIHPGGGHFQLVGRAAGRRRSASPGRRCRKQTSSRERSRSRRRSPAILSSLARRPGASASSSARRPSPGRRPSKWRRVCRCGRCGAEKCDGRPPAVRGLSHARHAALVVELTRPSGACSGLAAPTSRD